jgi:hypothetical protein
LEGSKRRGAVLSIKFSVFSFKFKKKSKDNAFLAVRGRGKEYSPLRTQRAQRKKDEGESGREVPRLRGENHQKFSGSRRKHFGAEVFVFD